ncbi:MAG: PASTA domain-containing protein [Spirochaetaceae bacterium]|jgi:beta-lactam-binding protein with PASTA domain|nr:PASTA domain-containing protein [Spirochaetaceae bacterium]
MAFRGFDLDSVESYVAGHARLFISLVVGVIVLVGFAALMVFFIAVKGAEETMVPDIRGKELTEALLELQVKELYPRIQLRYSQSSRDRGTILEQEPLGGTIVKAGRRVRLVVSQGVILDRVEDFLGRNIDDVRMELQALAASGDSGAGGPLITIREPLMYEYSQEEAGIILQQDPLPGTDISGPTALALVISRGPERSMIKVPDLVGLPLEAALEQLRSVQAAFAFSIRETRAGERPESVVAQSPEGQAVVPSDTPLSIVVSSPASLAANEIFDLFTYELPRNPYPLPVLFEALLPSGERKRILLTDHPGGTFTVPYRLPVGSVLILSMVGREMTRQELHYPQAAPPFEQL